MLLRKKLREILAGEGGKTLRRKLKALLKEKPEH
jgi:hypothetical protein